MLLFLQVPLACIVNNKTMQPNKTQPKVDEIVAIWKLLPCNDYRSNDYRSNDYRNTVCLEMLLASILIP